MQGSHAPWWTWVVASCVLAFLALNLWAEVGGPGSTGASRRFEQGRAVVLGVAAGYPAARAGIQAGDEIVTALGQPIHTLFDWRSAVENAEVGRAFPLELDRQGQRLPVALEFEAHWRRWTPGNWLTFIAKLIANVTAFALAVLIAFSRPRERVAVLGALLLASIAVTNLTPVTPYDAHAPMLPNGGAAIWRALPPVLGWPMWVGLGIFFIGPFLVALFFAEFPRPFFRTRRGRMLLWLPGLILALIAMPGLVRLMVRVVYDPAHWYGTLPDWFTPFVGVTVMSMVVMGMTLLLVNYRRLSDRTERRRVRILVGGTLVGLGATSIVTMAGFFQLPAMVDWVLRSPTVLVGSNLLFLVFPVSFAYAILRHQLLDVRLIVRQGVQYALARGVVVSLVPVCAGLLVVDLVVHGDRPLRDILFARGWIYAAVAGLALAAHAGRKRWLETLDRRFFREHYDAHQLLLRMVEEIRAAPGLAGAAPRVVTRIESALHPEFVALLAREVHDPVYRLLASAPARDLDLSLPGESKLTALVRLLGKPLDVGPGQSGWMGQHLPLDEADLVRRTRIALLVPVPGGPDGRDVLLVLGVKRSEEPYSREDQELLTGIAAGLGLLMERPAAAASRDSFAQCPRCGGCHDAGALSCAEDGARLEIVPLPRVLGERYRLERRLGQGGMGTVYEAADIALARRVAVKVIREELVGSAAAAERFRLEARAAASFAHPNVVTVHDFGIARDTRAFLVMELLRGASLRDVLRRRTRLDAARVVSILRDVGAAADTAHARQLVHRDLKPENVFLARDDGPERVKVLDFGLAKVMSAPADAATVTGSGTIVGTLHYMGPEQLRACAVDPGWDVWAMSVMAYEMLTGTLPFVGATVIDYQIAVLAGRFTPVGEQLAGAPAALQAFFERALALDPSRRPGSGERLVTDLEAALGASPAPGR
jgi:tRNA A-37 threonylcarbamoyl transferase component Bud32